MPWDPVAAGDSNPRPADQTSNVSDDPAYYDPALAEAVERHEKEMSFKESRKADKRLILYSLGFSGTIVMEAYGLALLTYLFSFSAFNELYGTHDEAANAHEVGPMPHCVKGQKTRGLTCYSSHTSGGSCCLWRLS